MWTSSWPEMILSGLAGVLIAVLVQEYFGHLRHWQVVLLEVRWMGESFRHLLDLWTHADGEARGERFLDGGAFLTLEEIRQVRRDLHRLTLPVELRR